MKKNYYTMSKKELLKEVIYKDSWIVRLQQSNTTKQALLRHFEKRILKIRNSLDYLLEHPYSYDTSYNAPSSQRREYQRRKEMRKNDEPTNN